MTYLGYSAASGRLGGRGRSQGDESTGYGRDGGGEAGQTAGEDIVIGRPRGGQLRGQVQVFDESLTLLANITGDQVRSNVSSQSVSKSNLESQNNKENVLIHLCVSTYGCISHEGACTTLGCESGVCM